MDRDRGVCPNRSYACSYDCLCALRLDRRGVCRRAHPPLRRTGRCDHAPRRPPATPFPGSTQSLRLNQLSADRSTDHSAAAGLSRRKVKPFSLVGVVWNDKKAHLDGTVQVRTRPVGSAAWTGWQSVETRNDDHAPDPGTAEAESSAVRGSTAPLWVGDSDAVQVRVRAKAPTGSTRAAAASLPKGLRLDLVDPGPDPDPQPSDPTAADPTAADPTAADPTAADPTTADPTAADPNTGGSESAGQAEPTELPALSKDATVAELEQSTGTKAGLRRAPAAHRHPQGLGRRRERPRSRPSSTRTP